MFVWHDVPLGSCRSVMESPMLAKLRAQLIDEVADQDLIISDATNGIECLLPLVPKARSIPIQKFVDKFINAIVYINFPHIDLFFGIGTKAVLHMAKRHPTYGFIWNVENVKELPEKMNNILTLHVDARLQQDILAQSGVKCFLNHGDSFSLQEAIYHAVPVLVIPLILEQFNVGSRFIFDTQAQVKFRTRPMPPLEQAVWHVEHLITEPELYDQLARPSVNFVVSHSLDILAIPAIALLILMANVLLLVFQLMQSNDESQKSVPQKRVHYFRDNDGNEMTYATWEDYATRTGNVNRSTEENSSDIDETLGQRVKSRLEKKTD
ncbi:UDP-glucuronosyltransferase 2B15 [Drosophila madeirensis]|uniref:UDP-glucuronosyltransferase 2B15 n=1 Tax=Drosophila madeirensis TaxID=30013 RepID=A0AAU9FRB6_DROMD